MVEGYQNIIKDWVKAMYGQSELDNPSWDINSLAHELATKYWDVHHKQEVADIMEDLKCYEKGKPLSQEAALEIAERIWSSEGYHYPDNGYHEIFIDEYLREKENVTR